MIELLVGMIASGKSTYAFRRAKEGALTISHDSLLDSLNAGNKCNKAHALLYQTIEENMLKTIVMNSKVDIIIDGIYLTKYVRARWVKLAQALNEPITAIVFDTQTPAIHARRRFKSNSRNLSYERWLEIAQFHYKIMEPVNYLEEGFK